MMMRMLRLAASVPSDAFGHGRLGVQVDHVIFGRRTFGEALEKDLAKDEKAFAAVGVSRGRLAQSAGHCASLLLDRRMVVEAQVAMGRFVQE